MTPSSTRAEGRPTRSAALALPLLFVALGCAPPGGDRLIVATNATEAECRAWGRALASLPEPILVRWLRVAGAEDPTRLLDRPGSVDLAIGGPTASYGLLNAQKNLQPIGDKPRRPWLAIVRGTTGVSFHPSAWKRAEPDLSLAPDSPKFADRVALVDPRRDVNGALGARLSASSGDPAGWRSEYARLVRLASNAPAVSLDAESAVALLETGKAEVALLELDRLNDSNVLDASPDGPGPAYALQGLGIPASAPHAERARAAIEALLQGQPIATRPLPPPGQMLIPDLLGATLVDAHPQLRQARIAIAGRPDAARALSWMTEAPPWPPASVARMRTRPDGPALLLTLARQVAPDPSAREWLLQGWNRPEKPIDGATLDEIATAAGGRLVAEPRFRDWLRAEWTAWARQRYRRVARKVNDPRFSAP